MMQGEVFKDTKERLSKRIGLKGKQFEKMKFAIIQRSIYAKTTYLNDGSAPITHISHSDTPY